MPRPSPQTDRVVAVLNLLADTDRGGLDHSPGTGLTATEIARRIGADRASCVHMLAALEGAAYLVRDPVDRRYHLGPALVPLGAGASRRHPGFEAARREMDALTRDTGHPCFAFGREGDRARLLSYTWDLRRPAPAMRVGDTLPLVPPLGAVFVAWADDRTVDEWLARAPGHDRPTADVESARLRATLAAVRELGYVVELQPPTAMLHELLQGGRAASGSATTSTATSPTASLAPSPTTSPVVLADPDASGFVAIEIDDDLSYPVSSIGAPVVAPGGNTVLALSLAGFAAPVQGAEVRRLAAATVAAAAAVTRARG